MARAGVAWLLPIHLLFPSAFLLWKDGSTSKGWSLLARPACHAACLTRARLLPLTIHAYRAGPGACCAALGDIRGLGCSSPRAFPLSLLGTIPAAAFITACSLRFISRGGRMLILQPFDSGRHSMPSTLGCGPFWHL